MDASYEKRNPFVDKLLCLACLVICWGVPVAYSQGFPGLGYFWVPMYALLFYAAFMEMWERRFAVKGLLVAGILGSSLWGFIQWRTIEIPDGKHAELLGYVAKAIRYIAQGQVDYRLVSSETVRALIHNNVLWMRDHASENVIISYPFGGVLEIHPIEDHLRVLVRFTGSTEVGCFDIISAGVRRSGQHSGVDMWLKADQLRLLPATRLYLETTGSGKIRLLEDRDTIGAYGNSRFFTKTLIERLTRAEAVNLCKHGIPFIFESEPAYR